MFGMVLVLLSFITSRTPRPPIDVSCLYLWYVFRCGDGLCVPRVDLVLILCCSMREFASKVTSKFGEGERLVVMACPRSNDDLIVTREVSLYFEVY